MPADLLESSGEGPKGCYCAPIQINGRYVAEFEIRTCLPANPNLYHAKISISLPAPSYQDPTGELNKEAAKEFCQVLLDQSPRAVEALRVLREECDIFLDRWLKLR
jgi:hypothetical protein